MPSVPNTNPGAVSKMLETIATNKALPTGKEFQLHIDSVLSTDKLQQRLDAILSKSKGYVSDTSGMPDTPEACRDSSISKEFISNPEF